MSIAYCTKHTTDKHEQDPRAHKPKGKDYELVVEKKFMECSIGNACVGGKWMLSDIRDFAPNSAIHMLYSGKHME